MIKYTQEQKNQVVILRKDGLTYKDIALKLGFNNLATISNLCEKAGLLKNPYRTRINYKVGMRFFNFVIVKEGNLHVSKQGRWYTTWKCLCNCGTAFTTTTKQIRRGQKSCGCLKLKSRFRKTLTDEQANARYAVSHYINGAKRRNLSWSLTEREALELFYANCHYCGCSPHRKIKYLSKSKLLLVNGIDRVDSSLGYILTNVVPCCSICNRAKGDLSYDEFILWIRRIKNYVNKD